MREFKVNNFLTLRFEEGKTVIYVDNKPFDQCKYLFLNIPREHLNELDDIDSIDEAAEKLSRLLEGTDNNLERIVDIDSETEFWAHCSNIQAWYENDYDTRLLHSNLSFPLLKKLTEVGDPLARKVFKEEIALRLESGYPSVIIFLIVERYIDYLEREDLLLILLNEKDASTILKIEKALSVKLIAEYGNFDSRDPDANAFLFLDRKVFGLQLIDLSINSIFKHIVELEHIHFLILGGCNLIKLPRCIEKLKNITYLDLGDNKLRSIPKQIKKLMNLQEVYLGGNNIINLQNIVEITKNLENLDFLSLQGNKIKILPDNLEQIKLDILKKTNRNIKIDF